jgi:hypothetical protein
MMQHNAEVALGAPAEQLMTKCLAGGGINAIYNDSSRWALGLC